MQTISSIPANCSQESLIWSWKRFLWKEESLKSLVVTVLSFGFKYGIPADADLVFDVRFLPNPYYIDELKKQTGNDKPVQDYVMGFDVSHVFLNKLTDMVQFLFAELCAGRKKSADHRHRLYRRQTPFCDTGK